MRPGAVRVTVQHLAPGCMLLATFCATPNRLPEGKSCPGCSATPPPSTELDTSRWAHAESSAFATGSDLGKGGRTECFFDRGCPPPAPIPGCPVVPHSESLEVALSQMASSEGRQVVLRGRLEALTWITQKGCGWECCNSRGGVLALRQSSRTVRLGGHHPPEGFRCGGDDSAECCGFELPDGDVVAAGRLRLEHGEAVLDDVGLCNPLPEPPPPVATLTASSCVVAGREHALGRPFRLGERVCVCKASGVTCRAAGACYRAGHWYPPGARGRRSDCGVCECQGSWSCPSAACWNAGPIAYFSKGSAAVDTRTRENIDRIAQLEGHPGRVEVLAWAEHGEAPDVLGLALRRARAVRAVLEQSGARRDQLFISLDAAPEARDGDYKRVDLVFWSSDRSEPAPE